MKRLLSIYLVFAMLLLNVIPSSAEGSSSSKKVLLENGYITETIGEYGQKNLTLHRKAERELRTAKSNGIEQAEEELLALGLSDTIVATMPEDELINYASGGDIKASISYYRVRKDGTWTQVSEEMAVAASKDISPIDITKPDEQDQTQDAYIRVWHALQNIGENDYRFATAAVWLKMPVFRWTDSLGSVAMNCTVKPHTASGRYSYDCYHSNNRGELIEHLTNEDTVTNFKTSDFRNPIKGNFQGVGAMFQIPPDQLSDMEDCYVYSDYQVYVEYVGSVDTPTLTRDLNSYGTYDHSEVRLSFAPELTIDARGSFSTTIGLNGLRLVTSTWTVPLQFRYTYIP